MTNQKLAEKLEEFMSRLPQTQPAHTPEQIALAQSLGITLPEPVDPVNEKLDVITSKLDSFYTNQYDCKSVLCDINTKFNSIEKKQNWFLASILCVVLLMALPFLSIDGCKQNPNPPVPISKEILIDTKAEYEIVIGALDLVANEWALSRYDSVAEAKQGLSSLLGGSTGGVKSRSLILAEFKDDCDFLAVVEDVKKKSV